MIPDYHLHSSFSDDAKTDIHILIKQARNQDMHSFCITDHNDPDWPVITDDGCTFDLDMDSYITHMKQVQNEVCRDFDLRIGVELGVMETTIDKLQGFGTKYPDLDFIIASSHIVDNMDPYYPEFFEGKSELEAYRRYFETILTNVRHFDDFDVYGHLDYILRYGPNKAKYFRINDYLEIFEAIFNILIPKGKGIEINTGSLYRGMDFAHPHEKTLQLYKEMGGEIITFGSDSHDEKHIGYGFCETAQLAQSLGFKYYCTYQLRKPSFHLFEN